MNIEACQAEILKCSNEQARNLHAFIADALKILSDNRSPVVDGLHLQILQKYQAVCDKNVNLSKELSKSIGVAND